MSNSYHNQEEKSPSKKSYVADFETTTKVDDCRVWCFSITEIGNEENTIVMKTIDDFFAHLETLGNCNIYFHNLKFDSQFCIYYMLTHNYKQVDSTKKMPNKSFSTLISSVGVFYSIDIKIKPHNHIKLMDSFKKLPFSVHNISKAFNIEEVKGEIDYTKERPIGYELDENEINYVKNDTVIVSKALNKQFNQGLNKMTIGSDALNSYKSMVEFDNLFPVLDIRLDDFIRKSYRGGWTYLQPCYTNKDLGKMKVYDVNSLYPSRMRYCLLPYDNPIYYTEMYKPNESYPLYIQHLRVTFKLKEDCLPCIQAKGNWRFLETEYVRECLDEPLEVYLTSIDLDLFKDMYEIYYIEYIDGYMFKGQYGMFNDYVDHWNKVKVENSNGKGDPSLRTIAKLMLNNLYGKAATQARTKRKTPYLKENGIVGYETQPEEIREPVYTALASFITAYARDLTIRSAYACGHLFVYGDTDSLHILDDGTTPNIEIHETELGKFKLESTPLRARFLRAKTYCEEIEHEGMTYLDVKCAGMSPEIKAQVTWDNFHYGFESDLKKHPKNVRGGVIIENIPFTITQPKNLAK